MKINILVPHFKKSGGLRISLGYAHYLTLLGHQVFVFCENKRLSRYLKSFLFKHDFLPKNTKVKFRQVTDFAKVPRSGALITDSWEVTKKAYQPELSGRHWQLVQHDERLYHGQPAEVDQVYRLPLKKIVVSTWLKEIFKRDYNQRPEILLNPIDIDLFKPTAREKSERELRILLLHHTYDWKGTKEGVEMVWALKKKYPEVRLILFGSRKAEAGFDCDEYYFDLEQEKLPWLYSNSDIFLCPSWDEGSGLPALEAMACQCAVVTYNNGGSRDYAFDGQTALVAERKNQAELKDKLEALVVNRDLRRAIVQNAYDFVKQRPTWPEQTSRLEKIIIA